MPHNLRHEPRPRKPYPKSTRLGKWKDVTLIAAFKCSDGVVVCADSQETLGLPLPSDDYAGYRVNVDKIEPRQIGHYEVTIGGAGHGPLVEGFTEALADQIETWPDSLDSGGLKARLRTVLLDYPFFGLH